MQKYMRKKHKTSEESRIHLRLAEECDREQVIDYLHETWDVGEETVNGGAGLEGYETYDEWLAANRRNRHEETVSEGFVPASTFLALDKNERLIGMIDLRHRLNKWLLRYGGNIGYSVRPSERRKGYAAEMLKLVLKEAAKIGLDRVLITCDDDNAASRGVILKCGGVLENEVEGPDEGQITERYWINVG